jgi:hypothetical protein
VKFWVFSADASAERSRSATQKITVELTARTAGGQDTNISASVPALPIE